MDSMYDEIKSVLFNGKVTQEAMDGLHILAHEIGVSRQELFERLGRRSLPKELFPDNIIVSQPQPQHFRGNAALRLYPNSKGVQFNAKVTPTAMKGLDILAQQLQVSKQELIERLGRRTLPTSIFYEAYEASNHDS